MKNRLVLVAFLLLQISLSLRVTPLVWADVLDVTVSPENPVRGDVIKVVVATSPNEKVQVEMTFTRSVIVSNGRFELKLSNIQTPPPPNSIALTVRNVTRVTVAVRVFFVWLSMSFDARNGTVAVARSNIPASAYDVTVSGEAIQNVSTVSLEVKATTIISADDSGRFEHSYDTSNIPAGNFTVKVGSLVRTVMLREWPS